MNTEPTANVSIAAAISVLRGKPCEECGWPTKRRKTCWHCGRRVCRDCWQEKHRCEPNHTPDKCRDLARYKRLGKQWISRLRARGEVVHGVFVGKVIKPNIARTTPELMKIIALLTLATSLGCFAADAPDWAWGNVITNASWRTLDVCVTNVAFSESYGVVQFTTNVTERVTQYARYEQGPCPEGLPCAVFHGIGVDPIEKEITTEVLKLRILNIRWGDQQHSITNSELISKEVRRWVKETAWVDKGATVPPDPWAAVTNFLPFFWNGTFTNHLVPGTNQALPYKVYTNGTAIKER